jgi:spermidine synthase
MRLAAPGELVLPNHQAMMLASALVPDLGAALDLGTGGGALLRALQDSQPQAAVISVESNPDMLALARAQFCLSAATVVMDDAVAFLRRDTARYDLILVDLFDDRASPSSLGEAAFYQSLKLRLADHGVVAMNILPTSEEAARMALEIARHTFAGVALLQFSVLGNLIIYLRKQAMPGDAELRQLFLRSADEADAELTCALDTLRCL